MIDFRRCDAAAPPASEFLEAVLAEYDAQAPRPLTGGLLTTPAEFSLPAGAYLVGFVDGVPACGGGIRDLGDGVAEMRRVYVKPAFRRRGLARALLDALERTARELGFRAVRLDSLSANWPIYQSAGYREIADYNGNRHAQVWGEKRL